MLNARLARHQSLVKIRNFYLLQVFSSCSFFDHYENNLGRCNCIDVGWERGG